MIYWSKNRVDFLGQHEIRDVSLSRIRVRDFAVSCKIFISCLDYQPDLLLLYILHFLNPPSMGISRPSSKSHIIFGSHVKFSCYSRSWEMSLYLIPKAMSFLKNTIGSLLNGTLLTMLNPLAWVMEVAAIMAIALANGRVTDLKFSTVFKYATTVNHLIGSFRTSGIGVALSGPDGGCPPNCCITCSGCSSTLLTIADACVMFIGEGCFTHLCLYMSLLNPTSTSEVMLCTCRNGSIFPKDSFDFGREESRFQNPSH
ncbi:hypothetical protein Hdeb2414_s0006g00202701 [Helianthus debilis subsp. tardiflorus]